MSNNRGMIRGRHARMLIKQEDFDKMRSAIKSYVIENPHLYEMYRDGRERPRLMEWFFLRASGVDGDSNKWVCSHLYQYMNDTHLQKALTSCMESINNELQESENKMKNKATDLLLEEFVDETEDDNSRFTGTI